MTKIFKHLAKHWAACLVIIALLLVQAYGDLTLPDYTSKIVDTGIQQSGIADAVPEVVRDSTLQVLELLMTDADAAAVEAAYTQPGGTDNALSSATSLQKKLASPYTVRLLRADADRDTLAEVFSTPDIVLYLASAQAAGEGNAPDAAALDTVTAQFAAMTQMPGFSRDAVQAQLAAAMGQAGESELSGFQPGSAAGGAGISGPWHQRCGTDELPDADRRPDAGADPVDGCRRGSGGAACFPRGGCHCAGSAPRCVPPGGQLFCL